MDDDVALICTDCGISFVPDEPKKETFCDESGSGHPYCECDTWGECPNCGEMCHSADCPEWLMYNDWYEGYG